MSLVDIVSDTETVKEIQPPMVDFLRYSKALKISIDDTDWEKVQFLAETLLLCMKTGKKVFICGNGGSAGNAMHIANDFLYGVSKKFGVGLKVHALSANSSVITCLANDEGYEHIFSHQLGVLAETGDILIVLSSSGNSPNILNVLATAKKMKVQSFAILGFSGGKAHQMTDIPISYPIQDVQISEDLQMVVCHMIVQWLYNNG